MENQISDILGAYEQGDKGVLIEVLQKVQEQLSYIAPEAVGQIADYVGVSESEIFGVATFYSQFRFVKPGKHTVKVCLGTACHVRGGANILRFLEREMDVRPGETTADEQFSLERVACFGCCALAPVVVVDDEVNARMTAMKAQKLLKRYSDSVED
jgi:NADH:ubiquinone oxidoreductase subunit E